MSLKFAHNSKICFQPIKQIISRLKTGRRMYLFLQSGHCWAGWHPGQNVPSRGSAFQMFWSDVIITSCHCVTANCFWGILILSLMEVRVGKQVLPTQHGTTEVLFVTDSAARLKICVVIMEPPEHYTKDSLHQTHLHYDASDCNT